MKRILDDHRSLMLLDEIAKGEEITQRDLGFRLEMAAGLVNTYLKNLVTKGYIKISGIPPKRFKYYLTPQGFKEKTRLTYSLLQNYNRVFMEARKDFSCLFHELSASGARGAFFVGVDDLAEIAYLSLQESGLSLTGAADPDRAGGKFFGKDIAGFKDLPEVPEDICLVITTSRRKDEMIKKLAEAGVDMTRVHGV